MTTSHKPSSVPSSSLRKPYVRPMDRWWTRNPFFGQYMLREATAIAVLVYAVVLTAGVVCLASGEPAWNAWLAALRSPWSVLLHLVLLASMAVHAWSWFEIMPKTLPRIVVGGAPLSAAVIRRSGWAVTVVVSLVFFGLARWWQS
jgi:fumarate reductase subunit C